MSFVHERLSEVDPRLAESLRRARRRTKHPGIRGNAPALPEPGAVLAAVKDAARRSAVARKAAGHP
jgi:hypothetical protein